MKRLFCVFLLLAIAICSASIAETKSVEAVFVKDYAQLFTQADGSLTMLDTAWLYYSDMTFEQYVIIDDQVTLFSQGTYHLEDGSDFDLSNSAHDLVLITRTSKYNAQDGLQPYNSQHVYDLNKIGYEQILDRGKDAHLMAAFLGAEKQPYGIGTVDCIWLYYSDHSFEQYAYMDHFHPTLFSEGTWSLSEGADFDLLSEKEDYGQLTLIRTKKLQDGIGYAAYSSEHTYDLKTLGYKQIAYIEE